MPRNILFALVILVAVSAYAIKTQVAPRFGELVARFESTQMATEGQADPVASPESNPTAITDESGQIQLIGQDLEVPSEFPLDLPTHPSASVAVVTVSPDRSQASLALSVALEPEAAAAWYGQWFEANGWTASGSFNADGLATRSYARPDETVQIGIVSIEGSGTFVTFTYERS